MRANKQHGNIVVAISGTNYIRTADNGISWTSGPIPPGTYNHMTWNGSVFCAVGNGNTITSPDGINWTAGTMLPGLGVNVTWNGSVFCTVGMLNPGINLATSPDGLNWTGRGPNPTGYMLETVAARGSTLIALGLNGPSRIRAKSVNNGVTWNFLDIGMGTFSGYAQLIWNGTTWCASNGLLTNAAVTSIDGDTWTTRAIPPTTNGYSDMAWNGSVFCVVGGFNQAATSPDGITWTARTMPTVQEPRLCWNGSVFFAVRGAGSGTNAATSPDGITWTSRTTPINSRWNAIASNF